MDVIPERSLINKDIEELMDSVHGAIKARIQLGFDWVGENELNLKPFIKDLELKLSSNLNPIINGGNAKFKPPLPIQSANSAFTR